MRNAVQYHADLSSNKKRMDKISNNFVRVFRKFYEDTDVRLFQS
jgi:hypothetical protein